MARVLISPDTQYNLCLAAREHLGLNWNGLARFLQVNRKTFGNWYTCTRFLPKEIFDKLNVITGNSVSEFELLSDNWGCVKGGNRTIELYGRFFGTLEDRRKPKKRSKDVSKYFPLPEHSTDLAEFIGIMLGDGGIFGNEAHITLGYSTDKEYVPYIKSLIKVLFNSEVAFYRSLNKDMIRIRVYGKNLVANLLVLGLVKGNKIKNENFNIPSWILENEGFAKSCIRGLIDTDGCVFKKVRKESSGVQYRSIGIKFTTASERLILTVIKAFQQLNFKVARSRRDLYLSGEEQVKRYFKDIGFSNPKHRNKYINFLHDYGWVKSH